MTAAEPGGPPDGVEPSSAAPPITLLEAGALASVVVVAIVATASLALAQVDRHDGRIASAIGLAAALALAAVAWRRRPALPLDRREVALLVVIVVTALVMFVPGSPYAYGDKDPGVYVSHGFAIAREGGTSIDDELVVRGLPVESLTPGARFPGFWVEAGDTTVTPQFYHLYPSLLATAIDVVGSPGAWNVNPVLAGLAVLVLALAVRRAAGWWAAWIFAALQLTFMPQVWQARYPSTEILAQLLLNGAILAVVLAINRRSLLAAAAGGVLVGTGFLARPDGLLYVAIAGAAVGAVVVARRFDRVTAAFCAGVAVAMPYALWNAFEARAGYTADNGIPSLATVARAALAAAVAVGLVACSAPASRLIGRWLGHPGGQRVIGALVLAVVGAVLVGFWFRESLLGVDYTNFGSQRIRSYDESSLRWLAHFLFVPGVIAAWCGLAVVVLRRWRWELLATVLPGLALLPLYLWEARVSPRLMWWVRRFVPGVLPALLVLIAVLGAWLLAHASVRRRMAGAALAVGLGIAFATQSLPLRDHREMGGSYGASELLAELAGDRQGLFLFTYPDRGIWDPNRNLAGPLWFIHDQLAGYLPDAATSTDLARWRDELPGSPVFVVTPPGEVPRTLQDAPLTLVREVRNRLSAWEESTTDRPNEAMVVQVDMDVWQLGG